MCKQHLPFKLHRRGLLLRRRLLLRVFLMLPLLKSKLRYAPSFASTFLSLPISGLLFLLFCCFLSLYWLLTVLLSGSEHWGSTSGFSGSSGQNGASACGLGKHFLASLVCLWSFLDHLVLSSPFLICALSPRSGWWAPKVLEVHYFGRWDQASSGRESFSPWRAAECPIG